MSLLSVNQLLVMMSTESLALVHRARGISARILDQQHRHFSQDEALATDVPIWQPALKQLENVLASMKIPPKTQLNIILASDFVRYLSLPAQHIHMSGEEMHAFAIAAYVEVYGGAVEAWSVKLNETAPRQPTMAAAVDKALLQALAALADQYQLKFASAQPYLMSAFNALSGKIKRSTGYLVIVELKRLLLVNLQFGRCQSLRVFSSGADWQSELQSVLARELLMSGVSDPALLIYAPTHKNMAYSTIKDWRIEHLSTKHSALNNPQMAMLEAAL